MNADQTAPIASPKRIGFKTILFVIAAVAAVTVIGGKLWYHHTYPYGWSHACSKGLAIGLRLYAGEHDHWLPHGEATPEASLSLLYRYDTNTALWVLGGKNVPGKVVETTLKRDGLLSPSTCGWHYIEGLRDDDQADLELAVAWDKTIGLWHNGNRKTGLMHEVVLLDGSTQFVSKDRWPEFITGQKQLLAKIIASRPTNAPPVRWSDEGSLGPNQHPFQK